MFGDLVAGPWHTWQGRGRQVIATARSADMFHGQFEKEVHIIHIYSYFLLFVLASCWPILAASILLS